MDDLQAAAHTYEAVHTALGALYWLGIGAVGFISAGVVILLKRNLWP